jgi:exonuclease III
MAFRKKWESIYAKKPDILIVQECECEQKLQFDVLMPRPKQFFWIGDNPNKGLAVFIFNQFTAEIVKEYSSEFSYILPLQIKGPECFTLFAVWAMPHKVEKSKNYIGQICGAMEYYRSKFKNDCMVIGDLNSNQIWDKTSKAANHMQLVDFLNAMNIFSVYHKMHNMPHGKESHPTIWLLKNKNKPYHLDYFFVPLKYFNDKTRFELGDFPDWIKLSDHVPLELKLSKLE